MNPIVIVLAVVVIILVYILYMYFSGSSTTLLPTASLKTVVPAITPITNPKYTTYSYGVWININTWDSTANKMIFSRAGNISLYLDKNTPTLYCDLVMSGGTPPVQTMVITDNFPIQKWTYVIISLDNQFMDVYIDGKLVKSQRFFTPAQSPTTPGIMPATPPDNPVPVTLGNPTGGFDAYVAKFTRWTTAMDPQTAWNTYMSGNGGNTLTNMFSSYNVNMNILKNNVQTASYSLY